MFKIADVNGESCLITCINADPNYGITNLVELDLLSRLNHPNLLHSLDMVKTNSRISSIVPLPNLLLESVISSYSTEEKLSVCYQLCHAVDFLNNNQVVMQQISLKEVALKNGIPYFTSLQNCIFGNNQNTIILGKLFIEIFELKNYKEEESYKFIGKQYRIELKQFINSIFDSQITIKEILSNKIFDKVRTEITSSVVEYFADDDYSEDHRDIIKLIVHWSKQMFSESSVELLFLSVDLFNRSASEYKHKQTLDRMSLGACCVFMASKLLGENPIVSEFVKKLNELVPGITQEILLEKELEIIEINSGVLLISKLYKVCNNADELRISFDEIVMSKNVKLYSNLDTEEWSKIIKTDCENPKNLKLKEF